MFACEHLWGLTAADFPGPRAPAACDRCVEMGTRWISLRQCRSCGHVGCCDSSPARHATEHHETTEHAVIRSLTPGESWTWCYVHRTQGDLRSPSRPPRRR
jgi:CPA1 family monovalent cation:H+ antiporter